MGRIDLRPASLAELLRRCTAKINRLRWPVTVSDSVVEEAIAAVEALEKVEPVAAQCRGCMRLYEIPADMPIDGEPDDAPHNQDGHSFHADLLYALPGGEGGE